MNNSTFIFDSKQVESSGGIYSLIVKTVIESNGIDVEDLHETYENLIRGKKSINNWNHFKRNYLRLDGSGKDMAFKSFLTWAKMLDISIEVKVIQNGNPLNSSVCNPRNKDLEKIKQYIEYLSSILSYMISFDTDDNDACQLIENKIKGGIKFLDLKFPVNLKVVSGKISFKRKFFMIVCEVGDKIITTTITKDKN